MGVALTRPTEPDRRLKTRSPAGSGSARCRLWLHFVAASAQSAGQAISARPTFPAARRVTRWPSTCRKVPPRWAAAITGNGSGSFHRSARRSLTLNLNLPGALASAGTMTVQEIITGETVYVKLPPPVASRLPGGKPWIEINWAQVGRAARHPGTSFAVRRLRLHQSRPVPPVPAGHLSQRGQNPGERQRERCADDPLPGHDRPAQGPAALPAAQRNAMSQAVATLEKLTRTARHPRGRLDRLPTASGPAGSRCPHAANASGQSVAPSCGGLPLLRAPAGALAAPGEPGDQRQLDAVPHPGLTHEHERRG